MSVILGYICILVSSLPFVLTWVWLLMIIERSISLLLTIVFVLTTSLLMMYFRLTLVLLKSIDLAMRSLVLICVLGFIEAFLL